MQPCIAGGAHVLACGGAEGKPVEVVVCMLLMALSYQTCGCNVMHVANGLLLQMCVWRVCAGVRVWCGVWRVACGGLRGVWRDQAALAREGASSSGAAYRGQVLVTITGTYNVAHCSTTWHSRYVQCCTL